MGLRGIAVASLQLAQQNDAPFGRARLPHDRPAVDRILLARGGLGVEVGFQIGGREGVRVPDMSVERQQQRGTFLDQAHPGMGMSVDAALVAFGIPKPAFQIEIVLGKVQQVAPGEQSRGETLHHPSHVPAEGIHIPQELAPGLVELGPALFRGTVFRIEGRFDRANVLHLSTNHLLRFGDGGQSSVDASGEPIESLVCGPPFFASRLRWID